ncbi:hypothetical protein D8I24_0235 (plasmid) [Cupriavidus necator H850]|nr:hypothetical protein D8I24_0235 [Cupriavidus necator H850]
MPLVILYDVQWMSRELKELQEHGHPVYADALKALSPHRRERINRLGDYLLDLPRRAPPLDPTIDFLFRDVADFLLFPGQPSIRVRRPTRLRRHHLRGFLASCSRRASSSGFGPPETLGAGMAHIYEFQYKIGMLLFYTETHGSVDRVG